ncbi:MAG TPA: hypothetical protein VNF73_13500 [Candidatus Saccharimonadales bacterium]|nr:hypothetical protein [Candidatus Saccharimonadales bacterium]
MTLTTGIPAIETDAVMPVSSLPPRVPAGVAIPFAILAMITIRREVA